jgi:hypothetical protein
VVAYSPNWNLSRRAGHIARQEKVDKAIKAIERAGRPGSASSLDPLLMAVGCI